MWKPGRGLYFTSFLLMCVYAIKGACGLNCYVCENVHDNGECNGTEYMTECAPFYDTCQTMVTWSGDIHKLLITKSCTKMNPCLSQKNETELIMPCDESLDSWTCVSCCQYDMCNENGAPLPAENKLTVVTLVAAFSIFLRCLFAS